MGSKLLANIYSSVIACKRQWNFAVSATRLFAVMPRMLPKF